MNNQFLDSLFPKTRQDILAAMLLAPDRWWYMADLAKRIKRQPSSLQRELENLTAADLLLRKRDGNRVYFRANERTPIFSELRGLFAKTSGLIDILRETLKPHMREIAIAFVYGSMASGKADSASDVDLMVIGDTRASALTSALSAAERRTGRQVNATVYSFEEFLTKRKNGHHLILSVLDGAKLFVVGKEDDLEGTDTRRKSRAPQAVKDRTRRASRRGEP